MRSGRERVFVTTKLWNTDHAPWRVGAALRRQLRALRLGHVDLFLVHWPNPLVKAPRLWSGRVAVS